MKNASKHADELKSLLKKLIKDVKPQPQEPTDALHALVRGAMSYDVPDSRADEAMKAIDREFVDLNELRVATDLEIQEMLGSRYPQIDKRVAMITQSLNNIFEREHTLSLERLKTIPKKDARAFLRELPEIHPFVESYVMLFALDGACVPTDGETVTVLTEHGVLEPETTLDDAQKFIEHAVKADECYEAYVSLRRLAADAAKAKKKK
jgi:endonuclease III